RPLARHRSRRLGDVAGRAPGLPHRIQESGLRARQLGGGVPGTRSPSAHHHRTAGLRTHTHGPARRARTTDIRRRRVVMAMTEDARLADAPTAFDTLTVHREGAVEFVEIQAPPMNLLGPQLVRDLV